MRHTKYLFLLFLVLQMFSCTEKKTSAVTTENGLPVFEFSSQDSTAIMALAADYMTVFNIKDFETASNMLYTVHNDSIFPLTDIQRGGYIEAMKHLPIYGAAVKEMKLYSDRDNELRIAVQIAADGNLETEVGTINFVLNPVEVEGKWYLTLRDEYAEGVGVYH